jgi:hypothetical protein
VHRFQYGVQYGCAGGLPNRYKTADRWLHPPLVEQLREVPEASRVWDDDSFSSAVPSGRKDAPISSAVQSDRKDAPLSPGMPSGINALSFLSGIPAGVALSSVRNVGDNAFEVRIFSIASENVRFDLILPCFITSAARVNLAGEAMESVGLKGSVNTKGARLPVEIEPGQMQTFWFHCG